jgi:hypothetical protein
LIPRICKKEKRNEKYFWDFFGTVNIFCMSSPTKQVSARRLPPIANPNPGRLLVRRSPKTTTDVEEREALMSNIGASGSNTIRPSSQDVDKGMFIADHDCIFVFSFNAFLQRVEKS